MRVAPINAIKMDPCPSAGKDQSMREWTKLAKRWAHSLPVELMEGPGRYRVQTAVTAGLNAKPRVKTAWNRVLEPHEKKFEEASEPFPELGDLLLELKETWWKKRKSWRRKNINFAI